MSAKETLTAELIRQILNYDHSSGVFTWKHRQLCMFSDKRYSAKHNCATWNGKFSGKVAGCNSSTHGYYVIRISDSLYLAHRLAWLHFYGEWPKVDIDHINMDRSDNRISNLRLANRSQNMANTRSHKDSMTGVKGIYFDKRKGKFIARICVLGKTRIIGSFNTPDEAGKAYKIESEKMFGQFARVG